MLALSVCVGMLSAGKRLFAYEVLMDGTGAPVKLVSLYGITTVVLRGAQVGALILGNALMMCAVKGVASVTLILSVFVLMVLACGAACATCGTGKWYGTVGSVCAMMTDGSHCVLTHNQSASTRHRFECHHAWLSETLLCFAGGLPSPLDVFCTVHQVVGAVPCPAVLHARSRGQRLQPRYRYVQKQSLQQFRFSC
jgi:hypothetical protein